MRDPIGKFPSLETLQHELPVLLRHLPGFRQGHLAPEDCMAVVEALAEAGFEKINFAGGEPTLCPWLPHLLRRARELALTTSVVTNGSCITREWLARTEGCLDWAAVSIDTLNPVKLQSLGRTTRNGPLIQVDYLRIVDLLKEAGVRLKVNTVVTRQNCDEDLGGFVSLARPERWKLFQALPVGAQNDGKVNNLLIARKSSTGTWRATGMWSPWALRWYPKATS